MRRTSHVVLISLLALGGCVTRIGPEELDPAGSLAGETWDDDGPPPGEEAIDAPADTVLDGELGTSTEALRAGERIELPFPCGQVWAGQTRTGHSPQNSIDFNRNNDLGDTVVAAASGVVTCVENLSSTSYGCWIEIDHGGGVRTRYAHLDSQAVRVGQSVSQGQRIGTLGNTGGSTGPHLHFEVRRDGVAIRPSFHGVGALFFGTRNYTSQNACGADGGGGTTTSVVGRVNTSGAPLTIRAGASIHLPLKWGRSSIVQNSLQAQMGDIRPRTAP
jgi:murein DD-endopeptidase MepM/ murein hydrolase activator NlpD